MTLVTVGRTNEGIAPAEFQEAVESWARQHGGHASLHWCGPPLNVWQVRLDLKANDPRLHSRQPYETVELHQWTDPNDPDADPALVKRLKGQAKDAGLKRTRAAYVSYRLDELGATGIIEILERGSLMSGRGEFEDPEDALRQVRKRQERARESLRRELRDAAQHAANRVRRQIGKIPFLPVGTDLEDNTLTKSP